jgi:nicotinate (nicotinamide) nucleotide adenylyltransferase/ribosome silencing factor RsfS/YbeB/iojap
MTRRERIGLFGGTFDPIHNGHLQAARLVQRRFGLDRVFFVPAAVPPHKGRPDMAPARDRLRMTALTVAGRKSWTASPVELRAGGPSYSIRTIETMRRRFPRARLFFIVGADAFREIRTWREWESVLRRCVFIVMTRPGSRLNAAAGVLGPAWKKALRRVAPGERPAPILDRNPGAGPGRPAPGRPRAPRRRRPYPDETPLSGACRAPAGPFAVPPREEVRKAPMTQENVKIKALNKRNVPAALKAAVKAALDKKGENVCVLDLRGASAFTDYFLILHGNSARQNAAVAENIEAELKAGHGRPLGVEGKVHGEWILVDYGDFVVHIFSRAARDYYALEKLWGDAPRADYR